MTHYYNDHTYTSEQAEHASQIVLRLIKKRRFFLHNPDSKGSYPSQDYTLDPEIFHGAIELDSHLRELYTSSRKEAAKKIVHGEEKLGIVPPSLENNRQVVVCNRYGGGFEICRVYPLIVFARVAPKSINDLRKEKLDFLIGNQPLDEIAPKTMQGYEKYADSLATRIWCEIEQLELFNPLNHRCVVMMESKLGRSGSDDPNDFADNRVADMQNTPFALGYLFGKFSQQTRIVQNNHVVFNTSRDSHVNVQHWRNEDAPKIRYSVTGGYNCPVIFVTTL